VKRLVSILLMNAWGGLRHKASLPTVSMVGFGVMMLLVASTVTAGASPDSSIPGVGTVAHIVHSVTSPITSMLSSPPPQKPPLPTKPKVQAADNNQPASGSSSTSASPSNNSSNNPSSSAQGGTQATVATLTLASLQCIAGQTSYMLEVPSAQLSLQTPTSAAGTVTWQWETRPDTGSNAGQITAGSPYNKASTAGQSNVQLSASDEQQAQWLYTATSSGTNDYSFRLHVTSPVDVTSNWVSVPQSANGSCPQVTQ
jgi:hypothetical protein